MINQAPTKLFSKEEYLKLVSVDWQISLKNLYQRVDFNVSELE